MNMFRLLKAIGMILLYLIIVFVPAFICVMFLTFYPLIFGSTLGLIVFSMLVISVYRNME